jgi:hypothetical protein
MEEQQVPRDCYMQKSVEKGTWEDQNKDGWMKLMEMQGNWDKDVVVTSFEIEKAGGNSN